MKKNNQILQQYEAKMNNFAVLSESAATCTKILVQRTVVQGLKELIG